MKIKATRCHQILKKNKIDYPVPTLWQAFFWKYRLPILFKQKQWATEKLDKIIIWIKLKLSCQIAAYSTLHGHNFKF